MPLNKIKISLIYYVCLFNGLLQISAEIIWAKFLVLHLSSDTLSNVIVASTFILGTGLGCYVFQRRKFQKSHLYPRLHLLLGVISWIIYWGHQKLVGIYTEMPLSLTQFQTTFSWILIFVTTLFVFVPSLVMGAFFPLFFDKVTANQQEYNLSKGLCYFSFSVGGIMAILLVPLVIFPYLSFQSMFSVLTLLNLIIALCSYLIFKSFNKNVEAITSHPTFFAKSHWPLYLHLIINSFTFMAFETLFFHPLNTIDPGSPYNFGLILFFILVGPTIGAYFFSKYPPKIKIIYFLYFASLISLCLGMILYSLVAQDNTPLPPLHVRWEVLLTYLFLVILPFGAFSGSTISAVLNSNIKSQISASTVILLTSLSCFISGVFCQVFASKLIGSKSLFQILIYIGLTYSLVCFSFLEVHEGKKRIVKGFSTLILSGFAVLALQFVSWDLVLFGLRSKQFDLAEGPGGFAFVEWNEGQGRLNLNGSTMSLLPRDIDHIYLEVFPLAVEKRSQILVLGLGSGQMISQLLRDPFIKKITIIEWSDEIKRLVEHSKYYQLAREIFTSPRVQIIKGDASFILSILPKDTFDLVVENLDSNQWFGLTQLKSQNYFSKIKSVLKKDGVYINKYNYLGEENFNSILSSLSSNFKNIEQFAFSTPGSSYVPFLVTTNGGFTLNEELLTQTLESRGLKLGLKFPYVNDFLMHKRSIDWSLIRSHRPIKEDFIGMEYQLGPFRKGLIKTLKESIEQWKIALLKRP